MSSTPDRVWCNITVQLHGLPVVSQRDSPPTLLQPFLSPGLFCCWLGPKLLFLHPDLPSSHSVPSYALSLEPTTLSLHLAGLNFSPLSALAPVLACTSGFPQMGLPLHAGAGLFLACEPVWRAAPGTFSLKFLSGSLLVAVLLASWPRLRSSARALRRCISLCARTLPCCPLSIPHKTCDYFSPYASLCITCVQPILWEPPESML